jgi:DNA adenine methylase
VDGQRLSTQIKPFRLKWAGGKRWLAEALVPSLGVESFRDGLCEPFAGGAALSFSCGASRVHLGDSNFDLIETYKAIKAEPTIVAKGLAGLALDAETFLRVREQDPATRAERAVRMIFLNRTAFGGLWRVNRFGEFNVPFGCKPETRLPTEEELVETGRLLRKSRLESGDFQRVARGTTAGLIYFDPPYTVAHNHNGFTRYNERIFSWADQIRLSETAAALAAEGRSVVVSNADHKDLRELYEDGPFKLYRVSRLSNLAAKADLRGTASELLVVSKNVRLRRLPSFASRI